MGGRETLLQASPGSFGGKQGTGKEAPNMCFLLPSETPHHSPVYMVCVLATPSDWESHRCGPDFAHAVPWTWNTGLAPSPPLG